MQIVRSVRFAAALRVCRPRAVRRGVRRRLFDQLDANRQHEGRRYADGRAGLPRHGQTERRQDAHRRVGARSTSSRSRRAPPRSSTRIGAEGELAAVDKNANYPDAANAFPTKVDAYEPNVEAIRALNPDLVIVASDTSGLVAKLDELKVPVLYVDIDTTVRTVDDVLAQIGVLGQVTGMADKASALVASLQARIDKVTAALQSLPAGSPVAVYHELDSTYFSASDDTFVGDLYKILKMKNVAGSGTTAYPQLTQEAIIAANPQVIVLADEAFGVSIDSVKARPGWSAIDAVKNNKIFAINPDIVSRPGPRIVDALEQLAKDVYPERFP